MLLLLARLVLLFYGPSLEVLRTIRQRHRRGLHWPADYQDLQMMLELLPLFRGLHKYVKAVRRKRFR